MNPPFKNLFADVLTASGQEDFLTLMQTDHVRVERIVSHGQCSPKDFWYDQSEDEWVLLLQGTATLQFADESTVPLIAGDHLLIPRHIKHRVEKTSADAIWLAVHHI
jgi:cupin 2 domain-containing protein